MYHKELFYWANSNNSIKSKIKNHPVKPKSPQKNEKLAGRDNVFCLRRDFCLTQFLYKTKTFLRQKSKKMERLFKTKKPRLVADFTLDHTGGWGGGIKQNDDWKFHGYKGTN